MSECSVTGCGQDAVCKVRWGDDSQQFGSLCQQHIDELWSRVNPQIKTGLCFWIQEPLQGNDQ